MSNIDISAGITLCGAFLTSATYYFLHWYSKRSDSLASAKHVPIDQLPQLFAQQPPNTALYVALDGITSCPSPLQTAHSVPPVNCVQYSCTTYSTIRHFFIPIFRLSSVSSSIASEFSHRSVDFYLSPFRSGSQLSSNNANEITNPFDVFSLTMESPSTRVLIPGNLPVESGYLSPLVQTISDTSAEKALKANEFINQLQQGNVVTSERFVETCIPVGTPMTAVGWVKLVNGELVLLPTPHATVTPASAFVQPTESSNFIANPSTISTSTVKFFNSTSESDSYYNHPVIISSRSFESMVEIERARTLRIRRFCFIGVAITAASAIYFVARNVYRIYCRHTELSQLMAFHEMRRLRKERKRKEAERRAADGRRKAKLKYIRDRDLVQERNNYPIPREVKDNDDMDIRGRPRNLRNGYTTNRFNSDNDTKEDHADDFPSIDCHSSHPSSSHHFAFEADEKSDEFAYPTLHIASDFSDSSFYEDSDTGLLNSTRTRDENDEDATLCVICQDNRANAVLLDCAHMYTCMECAQQVHLCPVCRKTIKQRVKVFFN